MELGPAPGEMDFERRALAGEVPRADGGACGVWGTKVDGNASAGDGGKSADGERQTSAARALLGARRRGRRRGW